MNNFIHRRDIRSKLKSFYPSGDIEYDTRTRNISLLFKLSQKLNLPLATRLTCFYLYHRYSLHHPLSMEENIPLFIAFISFSCKLQETVRKLRDIHAACQGIFTGDVKEFMDQKDQIIYHELEIEEALDFNLKIDLPSRYVIRLCRALRGDVTVGQRAWDIMTRSYFTNVCIQYPPHVIAFSALYMASYLESTTSIRASMGEKFGIHVSDVYSCGYQIVQHLILDPFYTCDPRMERALNDLKRKLR